MTERGEMTSRPYPSGGASYEHEIYANVDDGAGIRPGLYWYDPVKHGLCLVWEADAGTRAPIQNAGRTAADQGRPQVLLIMSARFQRVSWKYDSITYATILKDTGVLYATIYLVATATRRARASSRTRACSSRRCTSELPRWGWRLAPSPSGTRTSSPERSAAATSRR